MANLIQIRFLETIQLSNCGIECVRTERFSQPVKEVWMPQVTQAFQKVCEAIHPQAFHVHFVTQVIGEQRFGNVDFYTGIPESVLARWNLPFHYRSASFATQRSNGLNFLVK